jgi:hypothetical protein
MHNQVINEYATDAGLLANTDWVVTMPTKNKYVSVGTGSRHRRSSATSTAPRALRRHPDRLLGSRREEEHDAGRILAAAAGCHAALCWEANVITFKSAACSARQLELPRRQRKGFVNGWAELTFIYTNASSSGRHDARRHPERLQRSLVAERDVLGLPWSVSRSAYNNNVIVVGGKNVQSTYVRTSRTRRTRHHVGAPVP